MLSSCLMCFTRSATSSLSFLKTCDKSAQENSSYEPLPLYHPSPMSSPLSVFDRSRPHTRTRFMCFLWLAGNPGQVGHLEFHCIACRLPPSQTHFPLQMRMRKKRQNVSLEKSKTLALAVAVRWGGTLDEELVTSLERVSANARLLFFLMSAPRHYRMKAQHKNLV